ncbi:hypothetical protein PPACK8108_LOCUS6847, partial [Phakopsora pachyrhizi]
SVYQTATIVTLNRPSTFKTLWSLVSRGFMDRMDRSECVELIRESSLKSISFFGIPKSINTLNRFNQIISLDSDSTSSDCRRSYKESYNSSSAEIYNRCLRLWKSVQDPLSERLIAKLSDSNPDLPNPIILSHYGHLLSDPAERPVMGDGVNWLLRDEGVSWIIKSIDQLVARVHQIESSIIKSSNLTKHQSLYKL